MIEQAHVNVHLDGVDGVHIRQLRHIIARSTWAGWLVRLWALRGGSNGDAERSLRAGAGIAAAVNVFDRGSD